MTPKKISFLAAFVAGLTIPSAAFATNGEFSHGYGAIQNGMGGAGVALPQDAMTGTVNPANTAFVADDVYLGVAWFSPRREYTVTGPVNPTMPFPPFSGPTVESGSENFGIPSFAWNKMIDDKSAFNFALYGNGGMNTDWKAGDTPMGAGTFAGGDAGVDYSQLFLDFTYARKFSETASWGVTGIVNYSMFEGKGLSQFAQASLDPANLSDNGSDSDVGFGAKIGVVGEVAPGFTLGASYRSKISNTFDDYAGLFAKQGSLDIPASATIGLGYQADRYAVAFDVQHIFYEDVDAIANPSRNFFGCQMGDPSQCLGGSNGVGFGWRDMTVFKIGYQREAGNGWTWRLGYSHGKQPIRAEDVTFNILAPGVIEDHFTFGVSKEMQNGKKWHAAFMYGAEECVDGPHMFNPAQQVEICMDQYQLEVGFTF